MTVILSKSVFFHTPKTGGNWVEEFLTKSNLVVHNMRGIGAAHATLSDLPKLGHEGARHLPSFTFVRHPASWWRSYWAFKIRNGWDNPNTIDRECQDSSFHGFLRKMLANYRGFLTKEFRRRTLGVTYVGRTESLREDLMRILTLIGERFDDEMLYSKKPSNASGSQFVGYTKELLSEVVEAEKEAIEEWGYGLHGYSGT